MIEDKGSYYLINPRASNSEIILTCEHGNYEMPEGYKTLGLTRDDFNSTITHDIGAKRIALELAEMLDCTLFLNKYSRVLIDLNRAVYNPQLIRRSSHGIKIGGNADLDDKEYLKRINEYYRPYRLDLDKKINENPEAFILSVHSFTPKPRTMKEIRPWHVCVGFSEINYFSEYILEKLKIEHEIKVGINQPFNLYKKDKNGNGIAYIYGKKNMNAVLFEIRNDFISTEEDQVKWAEMIYSFLPDTVK